MSETTKQVTKQCVQTPGWKEFMVQYLFHISSGFAGNRRLLKGGTISLRNQALAGCASCTLDEPYVPPVLNLGDGPAPSETPGGQQVKPSLLTPTLAIYSI